jgi:hypothetical protein
MPRPSNRDLYRNVLQARDWRDQVEDGIKKYHAGLGPNDTGGLAPLALKMRKKEGMEEVVRSLTDHYAVATRGRKLVRFDTDEGDGIDLVDILIKCVIFGKQSRKPDHDLKQIEDSYEAATPEIRSVMFRETMVIAKELLLHRKQGAPSKDQRNYLMVWLNKRLRERFKKQDCSKVISKLLHLTPSKSEPHYEYVGSGDTINPESVREKIREFSKAPMKEQARLAIERRLLKVWRVTGSKDGRVINDLS